MSRAFDDLFDDPESARKAVRDSTVEAERAVVQEVETWLRRAPTLHRKAADKGLDAIGDVGLPLDGASDDSLVESVVGVLLGDPRNATRSLDDEGALPQNRCLIQNRRPLPQKSSSAIPT